MRRWKASKAAAAAFIKEMEAIKEFCIEKNIKQTRSGDSYYFNLKGQDYRISNHTREASNAKAVDFTGRKIREKYHESMEDDLICITAGKTRIIEIYKNLEAGKELDKRGYIK